MEQAYLKVKFDFDMADAKKQVDGLVGKINKNNNVSKTIDNNTKQFINVVKNYERVEKARSRNLLLEERINKRKDDNVFKSLQAIDRQERMRLKEDKILMDIGFKESKEKQRKAEASEKMRLKEDKILMDIEYKREIETKKDERYMLREKERKERLMVKEREKSELKLLKIKKEEEKKNTALIKQQAKEEERARRLSEKEKKEIARQEKIEKGKEMVFRGAFIASMLNVVSKLSVIAEKMINKTEAGLEQFSENANKREVNRNLLADKYGKGRHAVAETLSNLSGYSSKAIRNEVEFYGKIGDLYDEAVKNKGKKGDKSTLKNYTDMHKDAAVLQVFAELEAMARSNPKEAVEWLNELFGTHYKDNALDIITNGNVRDIYNNTIKYHGGTPRQAEKVLGNATNNSVLLNQKKQGNKQFIQAAQNRLGSNDKAVGTYISELNSKTIQEAQGLSGVPYQSALIARDILSIFNPKEWTENITGGIEALLNGILGNTSAMGNSMLTIKDELLKNR
jgi:hypothetical protein